MNRRDFLLFHTEQTARIVELSCRRLALRDLEWRTTTADAWVASAGDSWDEGEPLPVFAGQSVEQVLHDLSDSLTGAEVLRIRDADWALTESLRRQVDALAAAHRARGGRVES